MTKSLYFTALLPVVQAAGKKAYQSWLHFDRRQAKLKSQTQIVTAVDQSTEQALIKKIKKSSRDMLF